MENAVAEKVGCRIFCAFEVISETLTNYTNTMSRSLSNLAKKRALNLTHGLKLVIHQLHHIVPDTVGSHVRSERDDNPSGIIDKIYSRLTCIDDDQLRLGEHPTDARWADRRRYL